MGQEGSGGVKVRCRPPQSSSSWRLQTLECVYVKMSAWESVQQLCRAGAGWDTTTFRSCTPTLAPTGINTDPVGCSRPRPTVSETQPWWWQCRWAEISCNVSVAARCVSLITRGAAGAEQLRWTDWGSTVWQQSVWNTSGWLTGWFQLTWFIRLKLTCPNILNIKCQSVKLKMW